MSTESGKGRNRIVRPVRLIVYSDYLCPWCYNASVRLRRLEEELGSDLVITWRSYLLRPAPKGERDAERFRAYTQSWLRPAEEEDSGTFRPWATDAAPPSHSVPAHVAAKAAATLGRDEFHRMHDALLYAYFAENRDISAAATLEEIWREQRLPAVEFARTEDPALRDEVLSDHVEAQTLGMTGVPAARFEGNEAFITGALPLAMYRRWIDRHLSASSLASSPRES